MRKINEKLKDISSYLSIFALFLLTLITFEISCKNWKNQMFKSYSKANISTMWELFGNALSELPKAVLLLRTVLADETPRTIQQLDQKWQPFCNSSVLLVKTQNLVLKQVIWKSKQRRHCYNANFAPSKVH